MHYKRTEKKSTHDLWCDVMISKAKKGQSEKWNGLYKTRMRGEK